MTEIRTERTLLRPPVREDLEELHEVFRSSEAMKYWDSLPHTHEDETSRYLNQMISTSLEFGEEFVIEFEGKVIGKAGFWKFPDIGFIFNPKNWGNGLATESVTVLIEHGFTKRNLKMINADVDPRNERSIRLLENLGFVETHRESSTIKVGDQWCDSVYLSLNRPD